VTNNAGGVISGTGSGSFGIASGDTNQSVAINATAVSLGNIQMSNLEQQLAAIRGGSTGFQFGRLCDKWRRSELRTGFCRRKRTRGQERSTTTANSRVPTTCPTTSPEASGSASENHRASYRKT
jgi:hypothetical protein